MNPESIINKIYPFFPLKIKSYLVYKWLWKPLFPEVLNIENTNACNADCIMCPREKMDRKIGIMDFTLFKKIIDECSNRKEVLQINLHGYGECLLEKGFTTKIKYVKEIARKKTYLVTNGSLLNEELCKDLICSGLDKIKISFYGATEETYEKIHLRLKYKEVENNIKRLFKVRDDLKKNNPAIILQFLSMDTNRHERDLFFSKWESFINKKKMDELSEYHLHNYGLGYNFNKIKEGVLKKRSCVLPFNTIQVYWNGDVVPCCFDFNGDLILGNLKNSSVEQVWNSNMMNRLRDAHKNRCVDKFLLCSRCDQI